VIAVLDYRAGNLASVCKALAAVGGDARLVRTAAEAAGAAAIVVPGVGHYGATVAIDQDWRSHLVAHALAGRPLLGICLGMQWLFEASDEAPEHGGLGLLPGRCSRLAAGPRPDAAQPRETRVKVPHVGWNALELARPSRVLEGVADGAFVYFTHSYAAPIGAECVAVARHGTPFAAAIEHGSTWGVQFHPEKSGDVGLRILRNFVDFAARSGRG
jgi:glutamine amidotransferase